MATITVRNDPTPFSNPSNTQLNADSSSTERTRYNLTSPKYQDVNNTDTPRVIKKRSKSIKSERRSKSLENRKSKRVNLHSYIAKSKDDLDFGVFTVIAKPPNLWDGENSLRKGKSCPNVQDWNLSGNSRSFSASTPNLADAEQINSHDNTIKSAAVEDKDTGYNLHRLSDSVLQPEVLVTEEVVILQNKQQTQGLSTAPSTGDDKGKVTTLSTLDIGHLKRYFRECFVTVRSSVSKDTGEKTSQFVLETQTDDQLQAEELKKSFERLLKTIECVTEDIKTTGKSDHTEFLSSLTSTKILNLGSTTKEVTNKRRRITIKQECTKGDYNFNESIEIIKDFILQLIDQPNSISEGANIHTHHTQQNSSGMEIIKTQEILNVTTVNKHSSSMDITNHSENVGSFSYQPTMGIHSTNSYDELQEKTVISTATTAAPDNKFKFIYTIDAEFSHIEYNKLMKIIQSLQKQKFEWQSEIRAAQDKLEKQEKEKKELSHNSQILRESLEAANKAIKEINGKVHELKQTLVPLREENTTLRKENEELLENAEFAKEEHEILVKEMEDANKTKRLVEEKFTTNEKETEDYKQSMQERLDKVESLYRNYQKDMENKVQANAREINNLRNQNEKLREETNQFKNQNIFLQTEIESSTRKNTHLEDELHKKKTLDMQLLHTSKEKNKLTEDAMEIESFYKKEIEEVNGEITRTRIEIEKYREDNRALESENDKLKFDLENVENKLKEVENEKETIQNEKNFGVQKADVQQNQLDQLKKELKEVERFKKDGSMLDDERKSYLDQIESLQDKLRELAGVKREQFVQLHEHQRTKAELERLRIDLSEFDNLKRDNLSAKLEKERMMSELQHMQKQLSLLEHQQKILQGPQSSELKGELENIRNEMKDLALQNKNRNVELYTREIKGELANLKDQIKELDANSRQKVASKHIEFNYQEINDTLLMHGSSLAEGQQSGSASSTNTKSIQNPVVEEVSVTESFPRKTEGASEPPSPTTTNDEKSSQEKQVPFVRRKSAGEINRIYVSKSTDMSKLEKNGIPADEDAEKVKLKQIEDRIRRKREKNSDWSIRTPSIDRMRRKSTEELSSMGQDDNVDGYNRHSRRRSERSPSIGRSRSADPKSLSRMPNGEHETKPNKDRGRSPHRRNRQFDLQIKVDNSRVVYSEVDANSSYQRSRSNHDQMYTQRREDSWPQSQPMRRVKSEGRKLGGKKEQSSSADEDSSEECNEYPNREHNTNTRKHDNSPHSNQEAGTPNLLEEAMRERQHQAIINKKGQQMSQSIRQTYKAYSEQNLMSSSLDDDMDQIYPDHQQKRRNTTGKSILRRNTSDFDLTRGQMTNSLAESRPTTQYRSDNQLDRAYTLDKNFRMNQRSETMSAKKEEMIRNIKAEQELKMILKPTIRTQHNGELGVRRPKEIDIEGLYSTVDQQLLHENQNFSKQPMRDVHSKTTRRAPPKNPVSREEQQQLEKMEKARQNMLKKIQHQEQEKRLETTRNAERSSKKVQDNSVLTVSGLPILRNKNRQGRSSNRNSFITEEEAVALFSQSDVDEASSKTFEGKRQNTSTSTKSSSIHARTSTWSHSHRERRPAQNGEDIKSSENRQKPEPIKPPRHHHRETMPEYATVQNFNSRMDFRQADVVDNRNSHQRGRRNKGKSNEKQVPMSSDDFTLKASNQHPKQHDHRHCEECRRLNTIKAPNEPIRHCWQRYYPISQTTPQTSAQGFY